MSESTARQRAQLLVQQPPLVTVPMRRVVDGTVVMRSTSIIDLCALSGASSAQRLPFFVT
ncbi:hypothetical protein [Planctomicrobium sp. SH664]|uniref:hypothetical protein n=1 Tax=Planctomicrobium sp. SH664 TaxID=3448125 RepID=UPI003F5C9D34